MVKVKNTYHCQISYASWLCLNREVYKYFVCQQAIQAQNARGRLTLKSNFVIHSHMKLYWHGSTQNETETRKQQLMPQTQNAVDTWSSFR